MTKGVEQSTKQDSEVRKQNIARGLLRLAFRAAKNVHDWCGLDATRAARQLIGTSPSERRDYDDVRPVHRLVDGAARQAREAKLHLAVVSQESQ